MLTRDRLLVAGTRPRIFFHSSPLPVVPVKGGLFTTPEQHFATCGATADRAFWLATGIEATVKRSCAARGGARRRQALVGADLEL